MTPSVSAACFEESVWIKITGRGNFQCSPCLKTLVQTMLDQGHLAYVIDLAACEQMDSTFMGTITGIAQRLKAVPQGTLRVINTSNSNQELMENLGLHQLFSIQSLSEGVELPPSSEDDCFYEAFDGSNENKKSVVQEAVLSAHEALVAADEANIPKFKNLLEVIW